ncbi:hypothetical protein SUGI_1135800 [Cryptomeria japonica]|nr:hypothetical protein SUGI_1135800 [Cryptomeria japonica]
MGKASEKLQWREESILVELHRLIITIKFAGVGLLGVVGGLQWFVEACAILNKRECTSPEYGISVGWALYEKSYYLVVEVYAKYRRI